jgi:Uma2 family endonuclease
MEMPDKRATLDDLMREEFHSELIDGRIVRVGPAAYLPGRVAGEIQFSLHEHARACERGKAYGSQLVYAVPRLSSGRESFSPDVSLPANRLSYVQGPPTFAVEVRNQDDYHPGADQQYADKRIDYFEAGTLVVWDHHVIPPRPAAASLPPRRRGRRRAGRARLAHRRR